MSWDCPNETHGTCKRVDGAYCQPGMKGCILAGRVRFPDGVPPAPVWPPDQKRQPPAEAPGSTQA